MRFVIYNYYDHFPKIQTGGSDIKIKLTKSQISKIEKIYAKDFKLIQK